MKNKYRGRDVDEYLKERGIFEEVKELAQKRLEALRAEDAPEAEPAENPPGSIGRFLQRLRKCVPGWQK